MKPETTGLLRHGESFATATLIAAGCAMLVALPGCSVASRATAEWKPVPGVGPWTVPGQQAVAESRNYFVSLMADSQGHDERWHAPDGRTIDAWKVPERLIDFMVANGEFARWPETNASVYKVGRLRLAPYKFHLVSLFPDVLIAVPHDYGPLRNRSNYDLVGDTSSGFTDRRILNGFPHGPEVPGSGETYWTSATLAVPLTKIAPQPDGGFVIRHAKVELAGHRTASGWHVERIR